MKTTGLITRRRAIITGLASAGGLLLARYPKGLPPTYGNLLRMGDTFTYAAHRALLPGQSLVREYSDADITSFPATGTVNPGVSEKSALGDAYRLLQSGAFSSWRLSVEGRVATPRTFSLAELKQLPSRTQITRHTCEEGWTAIGQWTGVPLSLVLHAAGALPTARFVVFHSYDDWVDSIDMLDALHPQTMLAYGMNGRDLPLPHGAPVRLRVERQLGYKSMKYLYRIVVTDEFDDGGKKGNIQNGWAWYTGI
jgi:DMSO/TMAO reductase YedYZ molybdopterin-dependent catalytic subunit